LLFGSVPAGGQQVKGEATRAAAISPSVEDQDWTTLIRAVTTPAAGSVNVPPASDALPPASAPGAWAAKADLARQFYRKHPGQARTVQARKMEAQFLLHAVFEGDHAVAKRSSDTVAAFIGDPSVPEAARAAVAGLRGFYDALSKASNPAEQATELELMARQLIAGFPGQPQGYESLYTVASMVDDEHGRQLASELAAMEAPPAVKQKTQALLDRLSLVGRSLAEILKSGHVETGDDAIKPGRPAIIYSWSAVNPESLSVGEGLALRDLSAFTVIGVNLDENGVAAEEAKAMHKLPGSSLYDAAGRKGALPRALRMDRSPLVYLVDARGRVCDVRGFDNLDQKLRRLATRQIVSP
jgi:hypothetical protein